jgi:nitroreductase
MDIGGTVCGAATPIIGKPFAAPPRAMVDTRPMHADEIVALTEALISARHHVGPKHLQPPGPTPGVLQQLFEAAAAAPDHRQLRPWRFVVIGEQGRRRLAQAFEDALVERDAAAPAQARAEARDKAWRAPTLILAVADLRAPEPDVPAEERLLSLGAAIQNLLLAATAHGLGSGISGGRALRCEAFRRAFGIEEGERAVCFISLGRVLAARGSKPRPRPADFVQYLD